MVDNAVRQTAARHRCWRVQHLAGWCDGACCAFSAGISWRRVIFTLRCFARIPRRKRCLRARARRGGYRRIWTMLSACAFLAVLLGRAGTARAAARHRAVGVYQTSLPPLHIAGFRCCVRCAHLICAVRLFHYRLRIYAPAAYMRLFSVYARKISMAAAPAGGSIVSGVMVVDNVCSTPQLQQWRCAHALRHEEKKYLLMNSVAVDGGGHVQRRVT